MKDPRDRLKGHHNHFPESFVELENHEQSTFKNNPSTGCPAQVSKRGLCSIGLHGAWSLPNACKLTSIAGQCSHEAPEPDRLIEQHINLKQAAPQAPQG